MEFIEVANLQLLFTSSSGCIKGHRDCSPTCLPVAFPSVSSCEHDVHAFFITLGPNLQQVFQNFKHAKQNKKQPNTKTRVRPCACGAHLPTFERASRPACTGAH